MHEPNGCEATELEQCRCREFSLERPGGQNTSWPLYDIVKTLVEAADHLLKSDSGGKAIHDCDCDGWETFTAAKDAARKWLALRDQL